MKVTATGGLVEEDLGWDSDNDNVLDIVDDKGEKCHFIYISKIFGFHSYKEIVYLFLSNQRDMTCRKVQDLGPLHVQYRDDVMDIAFCVHALLARRVILMQYTAPPVYMACQSS
jgi:hypothetical protein